MINNKWTPWIIAAILAFILIFRECSSTDRETKTTVTTKDVKMTIPEIKGSFDKPSNSSQLPSQGKDSIKLFEKLVFVESKVNEELKEKLANTEDKYSLLLDEVRQRDYVNSFSDKYVDIQAKSKIYGRLDDIKLSYKVKQRDTIVQEKTINTETIITKKDKFGILAGGQFKQNIDTRKSNYELNAGIRLDKVNIIFSGNTNKEIGAGVLIEF